MDEIYYEIKCDNYHNYPVENFYLPSDKEVRDAEEKRRKLANWKKICANLSGSIGTKI